MKKNISYRDKLLELASIYRINDIRNYTRNKKYLTIGTGERGGFVVTSDTGERDKESKKIKNFYC